MRYQNDELGTSFEIGDRFTVRQQLAFRSEMAASPDESAFARYWTAALTVIEGWSSEVIPDAAALDMDASDDPRVADVVMWTANTVAGHMRRLETPPKN